MAKKSRIEERIGTIEGEIGDTHRLIKKLNDTLLSQEAHLSGLKLALDIFDTAEENVLNDTNGEDDAT